MLNYYRRLKCGQADRSDDLLLQNIRMDKKKKRIQARKVVPFAQVAIQEQEARTQHSVLVNRLSGLVLTQ